MGFSIQIGPLKHLKEILPPKFLLKTISSPQKHAAPENQMSAQVANHSHHNPG